MRYLLAMAVTLVGCGSVAPGGGRAVVQLGESCREQALGCFPLDGGELGSAVCEDGGFLVSAACPSGGCGYEPRQSLLTCGGRRIARGGDSCGGADLVACDGWRTTVVLGCDGGAWVDVQDCRKGRLCELDGGVRCL